MNTLSCPGLDGSNPLHFLAALGVLRLISLDDDTVRLAWSKEVPYAPTYHAGLSETACRVGIARHLGIRGSALLQTRRHRLLGLQEAAQRELEQCAHGKDGKKAAKELKETIRGRKERVRRIDSALKTRAEKAFVLCHPFAAVAECIHQVPQNEFRNIATHDQPPLWRTLLPGLAADRSRRYKKDETGLSRTRFSFSNGGSGKALLKDFRSSLCLIRLDDAKAGLLGFSTATEEVTGLMWEPAEQRNYALRWLNPTDDTTHSVPILNVLAFVGLSFFPVSPVTPSDRTTGFDNAEGYFRWPLWTGPLHTETISSLLAAAFVQSDAADVRTRGIVARFQTEVITAEKRNFFSPSRPV